MEPSIVLEGSGAEILAHAEEWKNEPRLKLIRDAADIEDALRRTGIDPDIDYAARLPAGTVWENGVPLLPYHADTEPMTLERVKQLLEEE